jgi:pimeloyl-ACP methyl ester carboxylesterase
MSVQKSDSALVTRDLASRPPAHFGGDDGLDAVLIEPTDADKPVIVFLHGWVMNRTTWFQAAAPLLDAGYGALFVDLPGHAGSRALPRVKNYTVYDVMADRLKDALDGAGLERPTIAAYSMGGTVALAFARKYPERAGPLFLCDPIVQFPLLQMAYSSPLVHARFFWNNAKGFFGPRGGHLLRAWMGLNVAGHFLPGPVKRFFERRFSFEPETDLFDYQGKQGTEVELFLEGFARTPYRVTAQALEAKFRTSYAGVFRRHDQPIHLCAGELDGFVSRRYMRALAKKGRRGPRATEHTISVVRGRDHLVVCTAPEEVSRELLRFCEENA